jgi:coenzyme PQQ precursor peptide PqqA
MAWTTPVLIEIRVGLEINGYLPAEFESRHYSSLTEFRGVGRRRSADRRQFFLAARHHPET